MVYKCATSTNKLLHEQVFKQLLKRSKGNEVSQHLAKPNSWVTGITQQPVETPCR